MICHLNVARGRAPDETGLIAALREGRLTGAGLDVLEEEPVAAGHPLAALDLDNVVPSPHLGASREVVRRTIAIDCVDIRRLSLGKPPMNVVNP